jgi:hypothetical protein
MTPITDPAKLWYWTAQFTLENWLHEFSDEPLHSQPSWSMARWAQLVDAFGQDRDRDELVVLQGPRRKRGLLSDLHYFFFEKLDRGIVRSGLRPKWKPGPFPFDRNTHPSLPQWWSFCSQLNQPVLEARQARQRDGHDLE